MDKIRIGTRGSKLALKQAALVQEALSCACGDIVTELVILRTRGDQIQDSPLSELGDKGVFASELEQALLAGQIDLAVHSAKDLPMRLADGLVIAAVLPRADVHPQHKKLAVLDAAIAVLQVHPPGPDGFDLCAGQGNTRLIGFFYKIIVPRLFVLRQQLCAVRHFARPPFSWIEMKQDRDFPRPV